MNRNASVGAAGSSLMEAACPPVHRGTGGQTSMWASGQEPVSGPVAGSHGPGTPAECQLGQTPTDQRAFGEAQISEEQFQHSTGENELTN